MRRATGIHFQGSTLRLVTLRAEGDAIRLCAAEERSLPLPFGPDALRGGSSGPLLAGILRECVAEAGDTGPVLTSLPGGWYQIQKVPLEVASEADRRSQMIWEAAQGFAATSAELDIHYVPARRSAFWVACRRSLRLSLAAFFADSGLDDVALVAEPIALINACSLSGVWDNGHTAAVLFSLPWLCIVSALDGKLLSAESIRTDVPEGYGSLTADDKTELQKADRPGPIAIEVLRRWLVGDPAPTRRRTPYGRLTVCGDRCCTDELVRPGYPRQEAAADLLMPFASCTVDTVPATVDLNDGQTDFAIAAGLAYSGIVKEEPT
jgi:hypothetical protein